MILYYAFGVTHSRYPRHGDYKCEERKKNPRGNDYNIIIIIIIIIIGRYTCFDSINVVY